MQRFRFSERLSVLFSFFISWLLIKDEQTEVCMRGILCKCVCLFLTHHAILLDTMGPSGAGSCAANRSDVKHEHEQWW